MYLPELNKCILLQNLVEFLFNSKFSESCVFCGALQQDVLSLEMAILTVPRCLANSHLADSP